MPRFYIDKKPPPMPDPWDLLREAQARIKELEEELLEEREGRGRGAPDLLTTAYMSGAQDYRATVRQLYSKVEALEWLVEVQAMWSDVAIRRLWDEVTDEGESEYYAILEAARAAAGV